MAKKLRLKEFRGTVAGELAKLFNRLDSGEIDTTAFQPLVQAVVQKQSDIEIWKRVLLIITAASRLTPPPSVGASFGGTPRTYSSASHQGSEQTKRLLHDAIRDELRDYAYVKVSGFFEKYFDNKSWTQKCKDIYESVTHIHSDGRWTTFPNQPTQDAVWSWWSGFQDEHLQESRGNYYTTESKKEMTGSDSEAQLDILLKRRGVGVPGSHEWAHVLVIGEHTVSTDDSGKFLQLARYARNVFSAQPRRQCVHGFILSHTKMELHVFDRSGTFCSEPFDIHKEPERFVRVIAGYAMMSNEELGLDTFIERKGEKEFVTVVDESGKDQRLQLDSRPIARQAAIVGRGTSCYPTVDGKGVAKFSWVSASRTPTEPDLLALAHERGVEGVPHLIGHRRIIHTSALRSQLRFPRKRQIRGRLGGNASFTSQTGSLQLTSSTGDGKKRKSIDAPGSQKKSRSNSQASKLSQVYEAGGSFDYQTFTSPATEEPFVDRVLSCQATRPAGRPLVKFSSVQELLRAIRDAIKVHRSLFLDGKILHRDISESNMIITDTKDNNGLSGMLIDLELGTIVVDGKNMRTGAQRMTGTLKYMAIEVLELGLSGARPDLEHTYRHDLESFFYVFLSICINHGWAPGKASKEDPLRSWYVGDDYGDMIRAKRGSMERGGFKKDVLRIFSPMFDCAKELAMALRDSLFLRGDELRTGIPAGDESVLYEQMIGAFDKEIDVLESACTK